MSSPDNSFSHISETSFSQQIIDGMVRSKGGRSVKNRILSKKGICNRSSVKIHRMKTRKDKSLLPQVAEEIGNRNMGATLGKGRWNLDDEITKVIEKGVALGFINIRKSMKRNGPESAIVEHGKSESWNLSDEVAKDFFFYCSQNLGKKDLELLCVILWRVWFLRNQLVHSECRQDVDNVVLWSNEFLAEFHVANNSVVDQGVHVRPHDVKW
ncbi:hypothetical protein LWI29_032371 [Acer saccharum]|uniref:Uncharacterized protein n=1 Tax=Acer saccharum TaxID=4024 RepID=A0AA39SXL6_ACESA|nr:hypothetical protein LWI29_032371 [Acer saccharum]